MWLLSASIIHNNTFNSHLINLLYVEYQTIPLSETQTIWFAFSARLTLNVVFEFQKSTSKIDWIDTSIHSPYVCNLPWYNCNGSIYCWLDGWIRILICLKQNKNTEYTERLKKKKWNIQLNKNVCAIIIRSASLFAIPQTIVSKTKYLPVRLLKRN